MKNDGKTIAAGGRAAVPAFSALRLPPRGLPRREAAAFGHFALTGDAAGAARAWAEGLPLGDGGLLGERLLDVLGDLNRAPMATEARFEVAEALRPALLRALAELAGDYLNQPVIPGAKARRAAELARHLYREAGAAYAMAGAQVLERRGGKRSGGKLAAQCLHRAITLVGLRLLLDCQLYRGAELGAWAELHQLFQLAETRKLAGRAVAGGGSIAAAYLRALMLGCCNANQLRQQDIAAVYRGLGDWARLVELTPAQEAAPAQTESASAHAALASAQDSARDGGRSGRNLLLADLAADVPPVRVAQHPRPPAPGCRVIDTAPLAAHFKQLRSACGESALMLNGDAFAGDAFANCAGDDESLSLIALEHLINAWGATRERKFSRAAAPGPAEEELQVAVGLSNTHRCLSAGDASAAESADRRPAHPHSGRTARAFARVVNAGPGGYCLEWNRERGAEVPPGLRVGEVLALRAPGGSAWRIAAIRWLRWQGEELRFGVELLAPRAEPCAARALRGKGGEGELMRALLLPEPRLTGRPDTLLTPRLGFRERQKVALIRRGGESCVRLSRRASATAAYSRFEFRRIPRLEGSDAPGARFESFWNHI